MKIASLREIYPDVPVLALTATATIDILDDIQERLNFRKKNVLRTSFERKNLGYNVFEEEDKLNRLIKFIQKTDGSGIIYVRSRKRTREVAEEIFRNNVSVTFYHAGLDYIMREQRQKDWMTGKVRVMVATNAFGMGIDKADVRFVIHYEIPDSIESYFQESGRAGRDGKDASAILFFNGTDKVKMDRRVQTNFPEISEIKRIYEALGNYFQIPIGGGKGGVYDFNILDFSSRFKLSMIVAYNSLKILEREGYIVLTEEIQNLTKVHFIINRDDLYKFQVANLKFDAFIKLMLRTYTGLFTEYVGISEQFLSRNANISVDDVIH